MTNQSKANPYFYDHDQTIVKFGCEGNIFNLSSLKEFDRPIISQGFAIKFVHDGIERYTINNKSYSVTPGSYLLLNGEKEGKVEIDSSKNVKGLCLNVSNELVSEVLATLRSPDTAVPDPELSRFFYTEHFLENQYSSTHTHLGTQLLEISKHITNHVFSSHQINPELFFQLAESLVADQLEVFKQLQSIPSVKPETRRDLCRRVLNGKEFIDSNYTESITIEQIARIAGMSEYHFFRLFKQTIGCTPYQYVLSSRLNKASQLLKADYPVSDVAIAMGFSDIHSFSKAFKKHFGLSPTLYAASVKI
ncbi:AraC family transcriptional regulator [Fluviicola sp.]|uniref:helix-turn-helix domain-containing protein n=1 Tax=Fluviicola sp. TaxID=1917219 RepID=UPI0026340B00|nr:AraC family transcriptional regulator [Fluviicola sp.]